MRVLRQQGWISDPRQTIGLFVGPCPETDPRPSRADRRRWVESDPCAAACQMTLCAEADDHSWGERIAALGPKGPFLVNAVGEPVARKQKITAESSRADVRPAIPLGRGGAGVPVQLIERELVAIFAEIAGYCGGSGFLDSGISQRLTGPEKA